MGPAVREYCAILVPGAVTASFGRVLAAIVIVSAVGFRREVDFFRIVVIVSVTVLSTFSVPLW